MRSLFSTCVVIALIGITSSQHGLRFGRHRGFHSGRSGSTGVNTRRGSLQSDGTQTSPLLKNSGGPHSTTPTGARGCFCLPANQVCDPNGAVPVSATRISKVNTRIVNLNPESNCPQGQEECCFGSFVGNGGNILPPHNSAPITGCGRRRSLIPGRPRTDDADFAEYPWMVIIIDGADNFVAGGALLSTQWVLTAAHKVTKATNLKVRVGDYNLAEANEVPRFPHQEAAVGQVIIHPDFRPNNLFNDVGLLRLSRPVQLNQHINPACLPEPTQRFSGQRCHVSGWGQNFDGDFQPILKEVDLPIVDEVSCQAKLRRTKLGVNFTLNTNSFLCAGGEAGKDACGGDGGSPLVCDEGGGVFTVVGLVAWGIGCARNDVPGVYVNVAKFSNFINGHTHVL